MHPLSYLFAWLLACVVIRFSDSQQDLCKPLFGYEFFKQLAENSAVGSVVLTVDAAGSASEINLTLSENTYYFSFNHTSRQVYVSRQLDAENSSSVQLNIQCKEAGKSPVDISVVVSVEDVNDNAPKFQRDHYFVNISETTGVNQRISTAILATDADITYNNNAVYYSVQDGPYSDYFQFPYQLNSDLILLKPLDYETLPNVTITIVAKNMLSDIQFNSTALLTILVQDEDDLNPVFTSPQYQGVVLVSAAMNTTVSVHPAIQATDADITINEPVIYSFHDPQGLQEAFNIDPVSATVHLVGSVEPSTVSVVVKATQKDNPSRYGVAMLIITVAEENSKAPKFQRNIYRVFISEALPPGTIILSVTATDEDYGAAIHYTIVGENTMFSINPDSGDINTTSFLDFERTPLQNFIVMASDGELNSTAEVVVKVIDANDNTPEVTEQQLTFQSERVPGQLITTIQAYDNDTGTHLMFKLLNYKNLFSIDDSGNLRISAKAAELTYSEYLLQVVVSDNGHPPRERTIFVTVKLPPITVTEKTVMAGPSDDIVAIALGVVAAVLFVVVIILAVYICRRRNQNSQHLEQVQNSKTPDARGLRFKNANRVRLDPSLFLEDSLNNGISLKETSLKKTGVFNYGFSHPDHPDGERNMDKIHVETEVVPYKEDAYNNNEMFQQDDSSDYEDCLPPKHFFNEDADSSEESSLGSEQNTDEDRIRSLSFGTSAFNTQQQHNGGIGDGCSSSLPVISLEGLDPDSSLTPPEQKSELTVYF